MTIKYRTNDVWNVCDANSIDPDASGYMRYQVWYNWGLLLRDKDAPAGELPETFVLFSPTLTNKTICRLLTVRKRNRVPSGFRVSDARFYQNVYVVDPHGDITDAQLAPLVQAGANVKRVTGNTAKAMSDDLASRLL